MQGEQSSTFCVQCIDIGPIINEHGNEFMDIFLQTRMGLMIKNTLHLKNRLQEKYNEEIYLLDELLK